MRTEVYVKADIENILKALSHSIEHLPPNDYRLGWVSALQSVALAFGVEWPSDEVGRLRIAERGIELSQRTQHRAGTAWKVQSPWKGYNKPKLTRHAELKSVTFSRGFDAYDYEGDDGGSEG